MQRNKVCKRVAAPQHVERPSAPGSHYEGEMAQVLFIRELACSWLASQDQQLAVGVFRVRQLPEGQESLGTCGVRAFNVWSPTRYRQH